MVGTTQKPGYVSAETVNFVRTRIEQMPDRFLSWNGTITVELARLVVRVAEIVAEYAEQVEAERDALVEDLAWDLNAARQAVA